MGLHQKQASRANQKFQKAAAACFSAETGATLSECGMFVLTSDNPFAASPDHIFDGEACSMLTNINTGEKIQLAGQCLLEIKTTQGRWTDRTTIFSDCFTCLLDRATNEMCRR